MTRPFFFLRSHFSHKIFHRLIDLCIDIYHICLRNTYRIIGTFLILFRNTVTFLINKKIFCLALLWRTKIQFLCKMYSVWGIILLYAVCRSLGWKSFARWCERRKKTTYMKWPEHDKWEKCASFVWQWARGKIIVRKGCALIGWTCSAKFC